MGMRCKQKAENILRQFTSFLALHEVKWFYCNQGFSERSIDVLGRKLDIDFFICNFDKKQEFLSRYIYGRSCPSVDQFELQYSTELLEIQYHMTGYIYLSFSLLSIDTLVEK